MLSTKEALVDIAEIPDVLVPADDNMQSLKKLLKILISKLTNFIILYTTNMITYTEMFVTPFMRSMMKKTNKN